MLRTSGESVVNRGTAGVRPFLFFLWERHLWTPKPDACQHTLMLSGGQLSICAGLHYLVCRGYDRTPHVEYICEPPMTQLFFLHLLVHMIHSISISSPPFEFLVYPKSLHRTSQSILRDSAPRTWNPWRRPKTQPTKSPQRRRPFRRSSGLGRACDVSCDSGSMAGWWFGGLEYLAYHQPYLGISNYLIEKHFWATFIHCLTTPGCNLVCACMHCTWGAHQQYLRDLHLLWSTLARGWELFNQG